MDSAPEKNPLPIVPTGNLTISTVDIGCGGPEFCVGPIREITWLCSDLSDF